MGYEKILTGYYGFAFNRSGGYGLCFKQQKSNNGYKKQMHGYQNRMQC